MTKCDFKTLFCELQLDLEAAIGDVTTMSGSFGGPATSLGTE